MNNAFCVNIGASLRSPDNWVNVVRETSLQGRCDSQSPFPRQMRHTALASSAEAIGVIWTISSIEVPSQRGLYESKLLDRTARELSCNIIRCLFSPFLIPPRSFLLVQLFGPLCLVHLHADPRYPCSMHLILQRSSLRMPREVGQKQDQS